MGNDEQMQRFSTGIPALDARLGGGLLPGTLTVVLGATGIGKTQLGLSFAHAGKAAEGQPGIVFDMTSRGDSQNHQAYAQRLCDWSLRPASMEQQPTPEMIWDAAAARSDYLHLFRRSGRRVTFSDLDVDAQREWKRELAKKLDITVAWFYGNFVHGVRRCVIDGVEPTESASDSFQFHTFDYVYHQILHKEHDWVARDVFRVGFRNQADRVTAAAYDHNEIATLLLYTTHEVMLDDLLTRPIESGDVLANANTIILMGKTREGSRMGRALHVAKHRGSACEEDIVPFTVTEKGLELAS